MFHDSLNQVLYDVAYAELGRPRGGLALATVPAVGGLWAVCGSKMATEAAATIFFVPLGAVEFLQFINLSDMPDNLHDLIDK